MKLQLSLHATKLKNVAGAFHGTSDPFAVVTIVPNDPRGKPIVLGKTEVIKNCLNPDWTKTFPLEYELGTPLHVTVTIFDENHKKDNTPMGSTVFEIGSILGAKGNTKAKLLPKNGGTLYARVDKVTASGSFKFKFSGLKLKNVEGMFSKSDPFFEICRKDIGDKGTEWNTVYRSLHVMNNLNPNWDDAEIDLALLCGGNVDTPLLIKVFDYEKDGKHEPMGQFETSVTGLVTRQGKEPFTILERGKDVGKFIVHTAKVIKTEPSATTFIEKKLEAVSVSPTAPPAPQAPVAASHPIPTPSLIAISSSTSTLKAVVPASNPSFYDYIAGGCEISLCVAIDFTGSNGDPRVAGTLHHLSHDGSLNGYEKAISAIGNILMPFDSDKKVPVWGFGAKIGGTIRQCFQVGSKAEVDGVGGILKAYREVFASGIVMSGPTDITEVVQTAAVFATTGQEEASKYGKQKYTILLILTDGGVTDVQKTVATFEMDAVCTAPLSVVIVGIGSGDFSSMRFLDDRKATDAKPDICDFVELNSFQNDPDALTKATLEEIPSQLASYFLRRGIKPLPPLSVSEEEIVVEPAEEDIDLSLNVKDSLIVVTGCSYVPPKAY